MKLLHLGDLHLGKKLNDVSLIEDQEYVLNEIIDIIKDNNIDCVLIAGDIYDKSNPSNEAIQLFSTFITNISLLNKKIFVISGNHDSDTKIAYLNELLIKNDIYFSKEFFGTTQVIECIDEYGKLYIHMLPFIKPSMVKRFYPECDNSSYDEAYKVVINNSNINYDERNILISHQFFTGSIKSESEEINVGGIDNISSELVKDFDYVALGHLHMNQRVNKNENIRYSGSPLKYSFGEANHIKKVNIIDIKEKGNIDIIELPLKFMRDVLVIEGKFDDIMKMTPSKDYLKIILTDEFIPVDALNSLSQIFPNIVSLIKKNHLNDEDTVMNNDIDFHTKNIIDIFKDFYFSQNNKEASDEVIKLIEEKMNEIKEDK